MRNRESREAMPGILRRHIERLEPTQVLVYGKVTPAMESVLRDTSTPWLHYAHAQSQRMAKWCAQHRGEDIQHG